MYAKNIYYPIGETHMTLEFEDACRESAYELEQIESICKIAIGSIDNDVCEVKIQDIGTLLDIINEKIKTLKNKLYGYAEYASKVK